MNDQQRIYILWPNGYVMVPPRPRTRGRFTGAERSMSPVVGVALMVAITVLLAAVVIVMLTGAADPGVAPTTDTAVSLDPTDTGTDLTTDFSSGREIAVRLNGETLATVDGDSTGETVFLPTAPGDEVHLVAAEDDADVLVRERFDAGEAGDFVAYFPFDDGSGSTLEDQSLNGNHGDVQSGPQWVSDDQGSALAFDGASDDYVEVDDLNTDGTGQVEAFTVAVTVRMDSTGSIQQFVEHNNATGAEWHLETNGNGGVQFAVDYVAGNPNSYVQSADGVLQPGQTHVLVGTYDGQTFRLYVDGTPVASGARDAAADMGELRIGKDDSGNGQELDGRMYEFRLYYAAMDDDEVEMLTRAMN